MIGADVSKKMSNMPFNPKSSNSRARLVPYWMLIVGALLAAAPLVMQSYVVFQLTMVLVYAIALIGIGILTGATGQVSLGQGAFFALGAYVTAIMMDSFGISYVICLPAAAIITFAAGFLFGFPALRLSGTYLALATFALAAAMPQLLKLEVLEPWTGGVGGIFVTKPTAPFGLPISDDQWLYYFTLIVAGLALVLARNLLGSRSGRAMMALRDNQIAASALGVNTALYKTVAFGLSAGLTGLAGGLGALAVQFVSTDAYPILLSIAIFVGMVVGGVGWLPGTLVGGAFIVFVPNVAEHVSQGFSGAVYGALLFAIIFLMPRGARQLAEWLQSLTRRGRG